MPKRAVVTGGAGFIGSHLVDALIEKKWEVIVIDNLSTGFRKNVNRKATLKVIDIRKPRASKLIERYAPHILFHLAAQAKVPVSIKDPLKDAETNIHATLRLLDASAHAKVRQCIFAGTGGALSSERTILPTDEAHAALPTSPYAIAKLASEYYGAFYRASRKLPFVSLRFANVYGPRQNPHGEAGVAAIFISQMLKNLPTRINGNGRQTRDYIYIDDVIRALLLMVNRPKLAGPYNVGTGIETSVTSIYNKIAKITGYAKKPKWGPPDVSVPFRSALDSSRLMHDTEWNWKVDLDEGLRRTVQWFRLNRQDRFWFPW